mmetsp:Transcript_25608/g.82705  ORF Transcript_25608/g.82705 Transcript_25608/m.82705 type:complete len:206 (-) Transcript_25608:894-1511(-)
MAGDELLRALRRRLRREDASRRRRLGRGFVGRGSGRGSRRGVQVGALLRLADGLLGRLLLDVDPDPVGRLTRDQLHRHFACPRHKHLPLHGAALRPLHVLRSAPLGGKLVAVPFGALGGLDGSGGGPPLGGLGGEHGEPPGRAGVRIGGLEPVKCGLEQRRGRSLEEDAAEPEGKGAVRHVELGQHAPHKVGAVEPGRVKDGGQR